MDKYSIVLDVIDETPSAELFITYPTGEGVDFGKELTPTVVKDEPSVKWEASENKLYVLLMVDPDAPNISNVNHWLVGNIQGSNISTGETITGYLGSGPPKGTGLHRYIFLVFEQSERLNFDEPRTTKTCRAHRFHFSVRDFAKKYSLSKPVAGNYFKAQWDEYVEERKKFITDN